MATEMGPIVASAVSKAFSSCEATSTKPYGKISQIIIRQFKQKKLTVSVAPTVFGLNRQLAVRVSYG